MIYFTFACSKAEELPLPVASFYANIQNCTDDSCVVYFYDNSQNSESRTWDFGNGKTSLLEIDSAFYLKDFLYTVEMTVVNGDKFESKKIKTIKI